MTQIPNGMIKLESPQAEMLGFTLDKFDGYLWAEDDRIIISFIVSKDPQKGNFRALCEKILHLGYSVVIPTPVGRMESIVRKAGYEQSEECFEPGEIIEPVELWTKHPKEVVE